VINTRQLPKKPKSKKPKFTGAMKQAFAMTVIMVGAMRHVVIHRLSGFIPDANGLI